MFGDENLPPGVLQLVYGVSPTSSGLRMLPLMPAGLLTASVTVGAGSSAGSGATRSCCARSATLGMFLLSNRLPQADTAPWARVEPDAPLHARPRRESRSYVLMLGRPRSRTRAASAQTRRRFDVHGDFFRTRWAARSAALFGAISRRGSPELTALPREAAARFRQPQHLPRRRRRPASRRPRRLPAGVRRRPPAGLPRRDRRRRAELRARVAAARGAAAHDARGSRGRRRGGGRRRHRQRGARRRAAACARRSRRPLNAARDQLGGWDSNPQPFG